MGGTCLRYAIQFILFIKRAAGTHSPTPPATARQQGPSLGKESTAEGPAQPISKNYISISADDASSTAL